MFFRNWKWGTTKWHQYAIELVLIVLGITISVWINGHVKNWEDIGIEQEYLKQLQVDLESDEKNLVEFIEGERGRFQAGRAFMQVVHVPNSIPDTFLKHGLSFINNMPYYKRHNSALTEISSAGHYRILKPKLRAYLHVLDSLHERTNYVWQHQQYDYTQHIWPITYKSVFFRGLIEEHFPKAFAGIPKRPLDKVALMELVQSTHFQNCCLLMSVNFEESEPFFEACLDKTRETLKLVKQLKKR